MPEIFAPSRKDKSLDGASIRSSTYLNRDGIASCPDSGPQILKWWTVLDLDVLRQ
jgi:hypothetical protein